MIFPSRSDALDFDLLAADLVPDRLDMVGPDLLQRDFFDNAGRLIRQRMFSGLDDFDRVVRPIDVANVFGIGDCLAEDFRVLFVKRHVSDDFTFGDEAANASAARLGHLFADLQMLLGEAKDIWLRGREFRRNGDLLHGRERDVGEFLLNRFDMRSRGDA